MARHRGARPVARQLDLIGKVLKRVGPERQLARNRALVVLLRPQHLVLPKRVVGILHRQGRPRRRAAGQARPIGAAEIARQRRQRPAVAGDVMQHQQQHVLSSSPSANRCARNGGSLARSKPCCAAAASAAGRVASVTAVTASRGRASNRISWRGTPSVSGKIVRRLSWRSTRSPSAASSAARSSAPVSRTRQRDGVGRALVTFTFQPVEEPEPALRKGERDLGRPRHRTQGRPRRLPVIAETLDQRLDGRGLEQAADRELDIERGADAADQPRRQQRMAAEREEVVVDADPGEPQHLGKQRAQQLLLRRARHRARLQERSPAPAAPCGRACRWA